MRSLLNGSIEGILVHVDNQVLYANERLCSMLGYELDELIGRRVDMLVHPDDRTRARVIRTTSAEGGDFEFRALRRDGTPIWLRSHTHYVDWDGKAVRKTSVIDIGDLKQTADTLRESENRLRHFAHAGSDWFWETDAEDRFVDFSSNVEQTAGIPSELLIGRPRTDVIEETRQPGELDVHLRTIKARLPFKDFTYLANRPNGPSAWVRISGLPIYDDDGRFRGYRGVGRNVTREIAEQDRARHAREQLLQAVDSAPTGIALFGPDEKLVFANEAYRCMDMRCHDLIVPGLQFEDLLRMRLESGYLRDAVGSEEEWLQQRLERHRNPGPPFIIHQEPDTWWLIAERRLPDGSTVTAITNITAQKRAELAHTASEQRYRELVDGALQGIIIHQDSTVIYANDAAVRLHGYERDELIGMNILKLVSPADRHLIVDRRRRRLAGEEIARAFDYRTLRKDGSERWIELAGRDIVWEGQPARQVIETDITERYLSHEALRNAKEQAEQANRVKSQFLANMSHELRTPLNAIVGFSDMIEQELLGPIAERRYVGYARDINASGQHLLAIINDILDLSRVEAGQSEIDESEFALSEAVSDCMRLIGSKVGEANIELSIDLPEELPNILADKRRIKQILINLLSNAVKFTEKGGRVGVTAKLNEDGRLAIVVADTGIGMAPLDIEHAMQPFVQLDTSLTRRFEGTGLGLALCRILAEMHQAELTVESSPGVGTRVTLLLPRERVRA